MWLVLLLICAITAVSIGLIAQAAEEKKAAKLWLQIVRLMETASTDPRMHRQVLTLLSQMNAEYRNNYSERLYHRALAIVEGNLGNINCRVFALEVGRVHYGLQRPNGITLYDEQVIQNDILARTGDAPKTVPSAAVIAPSTSDEPLRSPTKILLQTDNTLDTENPDHRKQPKSEEEISWGERKAPNWFVIPFVLFLLAIFVWGFKDDIQKGFNSSPSSPPVQTEMQYILVEPKGAEAVHPLMRDFTRQVAKEHGISEEEARKAIRKGFIQSGASKEDVERHWGK